MSREPNVGSVLPPGQSGCGSSSVWGELQHPISASSFLPPFVPCAKPWGRVQVPAVSRPRLSKIWKRIGGLSLGLGSPGYVSAVEELESQSQTARKRARNSRYVPALRCGVWDARVTKLEDGREDLLLGKAGVLAAEEQAAAAAKQLPCRTRPKQAAFPDLKWVPRKRDSTRWPIQRVTSAAIKRAALCPPTEFKPQATTGPEALPEQARHEHKKERTTRRASSRISTLAADDLQGDQGTPAKRNSLPPATTPLLSPIKRLFATPSLKTVAASPLEDFSFSATPLQVTDSPVEPRSPVAEGLEPTHLSSVSKPARTPSEEDTTLPLIFDQPLPQEATVSTQECKRRISLHAALGRDRWVLFSSRATQPGVSSKPPNRRQSLVLAPSDVKPRAGRRHTMSVFSPKAASEPTDSQQQENQEEPVGTSVLSGPATGTITLESTVVVDVGTNLDIFGQGSQIAPRKPGKRLSEGSGAQHSTQTLCQPLENKNDVLSRSIASELSTQREVLAFDRIATTQTAAKVENACVDAQQHTPSQGTPVLARDFYQPSEVEVDIGVEMKGSSACEKDGCLSVIDEESSLEPDGSAEVSTLVSSTLASDESPAEENETDLERSEGCTFDDEFHCQPPLPAGRLGDLSSKMDTSVETHVMDCGAGRITDQADLDKAVHLDYKGQSDLHLPVAKQDEEERQAVNSPTPSDDTVLTPEDDWCVTVTFDVSAAENEETKDVSDEAAASPRAGFTPSDSVATLELPSNPEPPSTPPLTSAATHLKNNPSTDAEEEVILETPPVSSPGFTPINSSPSQLAVKECSGEAKRGDANRQVGDEEITVAIGEAATASDDFAEEYTSTDGVAEVDEDVTGHIELCAVEHEAVYDKAEAIHDDSETEMLRQFVTRVKADKSAKAATSNSSLTRRKLRPQRRSGSMGSTATSTGSPMGKSESPSNRRPLSQRDCNSPSPRKKRKPDEGDHIFKGKPIFASEEPSPQPRQKRRRKRLDAELETTLEPSISQIDDLPGASLDAGPRRSTRARTARVPLKPTTHSANSVISMIPVRLPGQAGMLGDINLESNLAAARHRSEEKDLAALTRVNTRKNKANSVPAKMVLARQADDPRWRMKELKGVFDAMESREAESAEKDISQDGRKGRKDNRVRWAETLATYQDETATSGASTGRNTAEETRCGPVDELTGPIEIHTEEVPEPSEKPAAKQATRRTRASKLQTPTPVKKVIMADPEPAVRIPAQPPKSTASARGMATRRTKIASLGMSVNGTPAPKRRARA